MKQDKTIATLLRIFPYAKKALPRIVLGIFAAVAASLFALAIPQLLRSLFDSLDGSGTLDALY
jgi:ATP-binding cassette subfamily B protein